MGAASPQLCCTTASVPKPEQIEALFAKNCEELKLGKPSAKATARVSRLANLTPGDFAAVMRQHQFNPIGSAEELVERLVRECRVKEQGSGRAMGFVV